MVGVMEEDFVQASPIEDCAAFGTSREVLLFLRWKLLVIVECH